MWMMWNSLPTAMGAAPALVTRLLGDRDGGRAGRHGLAGVVLGPDLQVHHRLGPLIAHGRDPAVRGDDLVPDVGGAELAAELADLALVADPGPQQGVQVGPLQVAHAEGGREPCRPTRL